MKFVLLFLLACSIACDPCDQGSDEDSIACLNSLPSRDLKELPHKVYISLSTSPSRLPKLLPTLQTLDLTHVEQIFLTLPEKYRNKEEYPEIPQEILRFPKLMLLQDQTKDLGPIMKMLPVIEKIGTLNQEAIIISIDDDIGFPKGAINELIYHAIKYPNSVISGAGSTGKLFGILPEEWPFEREESRKPFCGSGPISYCDTVEGWRGIAYRPRLVNTERMRHISKLSKACRTSDDLVISYVLAESKVDKIRISNNYYYFVRQFKTRTDNNALHKIQLNIPNWKQRSTIESLVADTTNSERYQRCILDILEDNKINQENKKI